MSNSYWMVTAVPCEAYGFDKFALMAEMERRNIDTRPFFSPLSSLPAFDAHPEAKRFVTPNDCGQFIARVGINLPSGYNMTEEKVDIVCAAFREVLAGGRTHRVAAE